MDWFLSRVCFHQEQILCTPSVPGTALEINAKLFLPQSLCFLANLGTALLLTVLQLSWKGPVLMFNLGAGLSGRWLETTHCGKHCFCRNNLKPNN